MKLPEYRKETVKVSQVHVMKRYVLAMYTENVRTVYAEGTSNKRSLQIQKQKNLNI